MYKTISKLSFVLTLFFAIGVVANPAQAANTADGNSATIISPNGGETYQQGDTIHFRWSSTLSNYQYTYTYVNIYKLRNNLWDPNASDYNVYVDVNKNISAIPNPNNGIPDTGSLDWTIPSNLSSGNYVAAIFISYWNDPTAHDGGIQSDYSNLPFTIGTSTAPTLIPAITSLNPSTASAGSTITVKGSGFLTTNDINLHSTSRGTSLVPSSNVTYVSSTSLKFTVPAGTAADDYDVTVINNNGESHPMTLSVREAPSTAHTPATNVLGTDGTVYRISENNVLQPYTSAGAFLSYKFNSWAGVVSANSADQALSKSTDYIPPRNGALINDKGTVYLITGGLREGFANEAAFKGMGYVYSNVYPGDTSFMTSLAPINSAEQIHPNGTLINDHGTLYVMQNGYRVGIPSMAVLDSWGYWPSDAVPANMYDLKVSVSSILQTRMPNQMNI